MKKKGIYDVIVCKIVEDYNQHLGKEVYILDRLRAIRHETLSQDHLEKYFGFRKAYCKLKIVYRFPLNIVVKLLFPFREKFNNESKLGNLFVVILRMEEIGRKCE